jgi:protein-S-isoprenylcysteine O-methyltransferase Ste14
MKTKILPPRVFQIALLTVAIIHFTVPVWFIYNSPVRWFGIIPVIAGIYLNLYTDRLIKKYETTIKPFETPTTFIIRGPFRYSRNPIYLGMVLIILGCSLLSGSLISFFISFVFAYVLHFLYIIPEEAIMENNFGKKYMEYKSKVPCWL